MIYIKLSVVPRHRSSRRDPHDSHLEVPQYSTSIKMMKPSASTEASLAAKAQWSKQGCQVLLAQYIRMLTKAIGWQPFQITLNTAGPRCMAWHPWWDASINRMKPQTFSSSWQHFNHATIKAHDQHQVKGNATLHV